MRYYRIGHRDEWGYRNESTHEIRITGEIISFIIRKFGTLVLSPDEMWTVEFMPNGECNIPSVKIGVPLDENYGNNECNTMIDGTTTLPLEQNKSIHNREDYAI